MKLYIQVQLLAAGKLCRISAGVMKQNSALQHALNFVFIVVELLLNCMPFYPYLMGFMGLYTAVYGLWAFSFYIYTGRWIYPVS